MKRIIIFVLISAICFSCFALENRQKIYPVDSQVYKDISTLYIITGHSLPSTAGPWSGEELSKMASMIDASQLSSSSRKIYDRVISTLDEKPDFSFSDNAAMTLDLVADVEVYAHTYDRETAVKNGITRNTKGTASISGATEFAFEGREWWFGKDITKTTPFVELKWESWVADSLYSFMNLCAQNAYYNDNGIGKTKLNTNIACYQNVCFEPLIIDGSVPDRAFLAFGSDFWSVQVGRDRINWGGATTGNLAIADTMPYYDSARAAVFNKYFKYTYLVSFFPNKMNYYTEEGDSSICHNYHNVPDARQNGLSMYIGHRFEGRFFKDRLSFSVAEALMYESQDNSMQWGLLNPMFVLHNAYIGKNSNSTMAFELTITPVKGFNLYGQYLMDQVSAFGEKKPGPKKTADALPNASAAIVGVKYIKEVADGILTINPEFAYTSAYAYLRDGDDGENSKFGLDYVASIRENSFSTGVNYSDFVVGYKYGPDCIVGAVNASWEKDKLTATAKVFGMIHGTHDLWTVWKNVKAGTSTEDYKNQYVTPTKDSVSENYRYDVTNRNAWWYTFDIGVGASYRLTDRLELSSSADVVVMRNIYNVKDLNAYDCQLIVGAKYKVL